MASKTECVKTSKMCATKQRHACNELLLRTLTYPTILLIYYWYVVRLHGHVTPILDTVIVKHS